MSNQNISNNTIIAISSDKLVFMKSHTEIELLLLDGNDNDALVIEGRIDQIMKVVVKCYNARDNKISTRIEIDGNVIIFK